MISVIIPNFNKENFIEECFESLRKQSFEEWEAIVVDDGSTDRSIEIISKYRNRDSRFSLIQRAREPKGAPTCRNIGLENCQYEFVIFLDSDDVFAPYCFQQRLDTIGVDDNFSFYVFQSLIFNEHPKDQMKYVSIETQTSLKRRVLSLEVPWTISSVLWRKDALIELNGFDEKLSAKQDPDLIVRAFFIGIPYEVYWTSIPDFFYRVSSSSIGLNSGSEALNKRLLSSEEIALKIFKHYKLFEALDAKLGVGKIALDLIETYCSRKNYSKALSVLGTFKECFSKYQKMFLRAYISVSKFLGMRIPGFQTFRQMFMGNYWLPNNYAIHNYEGQLAYKSCSYNP